MEKATRPALLRTITGVVANEATAPEFKVMDGVAQWNKSPVSPAPGFNLYPFVRARISGTGASGDILEIVGKFSDGLVIPLGRATAGTGGVFPTIVELQERQDVAYGVRVANRTGTLTGVNVYLEAYMTEQARVLA